MMSILPKKHHNIILTTIQIHLEINILDTKPMPNVVKTPNQHYNVIKHNLQETNKKKAKQVFHKISFLFTTTNESNFCQLALSVVDNTITSN
jgi:outer membrane protein assembly factor BamD (BamD/ComL family)